MYFDTKKINKSGPKNAILAFESQKMSFFEEVMTIFQKMGFEKKMTCDVQFVYLPQIPGYYPQPPNGENLFFLDPIAVVFWCKNRVLCTAPPSQKKGDLYICV